MKTLRIFLVGICVSVAMIAAMTLLALIVGYIFMHEWMFWTLLFLAIVYFIGWTAESIRKECVR